MLRIKPVVSEPAANESIAIITGTNDSLPHFLTFSCFMCHNLFPGVSGNSRSRPFPRMTASDSCSQIMGMDFFFPFPFLNFRNVFFHSLPVPKLWECFFFIPFLFPNCGHGFFSFPSRSRIVVMDFFNSLPIPEFAISQTGIKMGIGLL